MRCKASDRHEQNDNREQKPEQKKAMASLEKIKRDLEHLKSLLKLAQQDAKNGSVRNVVFYLCSIVACIESLNLPQKDMEAARDRRRPPYARPEAEESDEEEEEQEEDESRM
jgi:hypothetical protein